MFYVHVDNEVINYLLTDSVAIFRQILKINENKNSLAR